MGGTVRFSELVKMIGTPEVYLPLSDPKHDRPFMRAVREERVLSLKQEPTGTKKDFGTVGYLPERYVSYLIFPKSLSTFKGQRVIGIKYDTLNEASLSTPKASVAASSRSTKPKPPPKPEPRPRSFTASVRLTATNEVEVTVEALNEKEARTKAVDAARRRADFTSAEVEAKLLRVKAEPSPTD
jgi:hypothetical protein